jgi:HAD superfamily hydrolase (TIGR01549 family)
LQQPVKQEVDNPPGRDQRFQGVIFDMDGTVIEPLLDFAAIRATLNIAPDAGILEEIEAMEPDRADQARQWLEDQELDAARRAQLTAGADQTIRTIRRAGLKTALLTRSTRPAMQTVLQRYPQLHFDLTWSREDGPIKPEPDGIVRACAQLGIDPKRTVCVGDFLYDIVAAARAEAVSVLLAPNGPPEFADAADYVITHLDDLPGILGI